MPKLLRRRRLWIHMMIRRSSCVTIVAKIGAEGSNPFARSKFPQGKSSG
jgi:hypothetical protein